MLEELVRPFQRIDLLRVEKIYVQETQAPGDPGTKTWGKVGTVPDAVQVTPGDDPNVVGFQVENCGDNLSETSRGTDTVRVTNPSDSSQYVDVSRIRTIHFYKMPPRSWSFQTPSTHFAETDYFAGTPFGDVPTQNSCNQNYKLNPPA
jgi:hypothetical protein